MSVSAWQLDFYDLQKDGYTSMMWGAKKEDIAPKNLIKNYCNAGKKRKIY